MTLASRMNSIPLSLPYKALHALASGFISSCLYPFLCLGYINKYHTLGSLETTEIYSYKLEVGSLRSGCRHDSSTEDPHLGYKVPVSHCILTRLRADWGSKLSLDFPKVTNRIQRAPPHDLINPNLLTS